jgi:SPP1 gp7 family putative phage head morphogenesis protein
MPAISSELTYISWDSIINNLIERIREDKISSGDLDRDFVLKTYDRLNKSAELGYGKEYYNDRVCRKMRQNLLEFSAAKTHVQQNEVRRYSNSIEGKEQYENESKRYLKLQNGNYLDVQAAWTSRKAQAARRWQEFQNDKDIYPRVKYRTMQDSDVRPDHAVLEGKVFDLDNPDLDRFTPPLGPRCRCWLEQTRDEITEIPDYIPDPEWSGNAGKTGVVFNGNNSYIKKISDRKQIRIKAEYAKEYMPYNKAVKAGKNNVFVSDFADLSDLEQNIPAAKILAKELKKDIYIRYHVDGGLVSGYKNPEMGIGEKNILGDLKTYDGKSKFSNFTKAALKSANEQGAQYAIFDISLQKDLSELSRWVKGSLTNQNHGIKKVILIKDERVVELTREQVEKSDFSGLENLKEK